VLFVAVHFWRIRKDGGLYVRQSEPAAQQANGTPSDSRVPETADVPEPVLERR
jgi:hypothetical protein